MTEETWNVDSSLADLTKNQWLAAIAAIALEDGYHERLDTRHHATFMQEGRTLLVTFETLQGIRALSELGQPLGWDMLKDHGWSHLCLTCDGDTWFRSPAVYGFFDRLVDEGLFDAFDRILFYGAGPCAYAAGAFSVAAVGARVLMIQPQATLDPRVTEWDDRFADMRRADFTTRYGYAPEMLDGADAGYVLYDPREQLDAMHAALFTRANVSKFRMRNMGSALQTDLLELGIWEDLLQAAALGTLDTVSFARLFRRRRDHRPYLRNLLTQLENDERYLMGTWLCSNVTSRMRARMFAAKQTYFEEMLSQKDVAREA